VAADHKGKTYGDDNPALTATVTGTVNGDVLAYTLATPALKFSSVGDYAISVTLGANANYNVGKTDNTLSIGRKDASVAADHKGKTYGDDNPALTATVTGTVNGDVLAYTLATPALKFSSVGDYAIPVALGSNGTNYKDQSGEVAIAISKANATIVVTPYNVYYDTFAHTATGTATGPGGVDLSAGLNLGGTTHTLPGNYPSDAWSFAGGTNYNNA